MSSQLTAPICQLCAGAVNHGGGTSSLPLPLPTADTIWSRDELSLLNSAQIDDSWAKSIVLRYKCRVVCYTATDNQKINQDDNTMQKATLPGAGPQSYLWCHVILSPAWPGAHHVWWYRKWGVCGSPQPSWPSRSRYWPAGCRPASSVPSCSGN